jgi:hypothetical protein
VPNGFIAREASGPFEPTALPQGFVIENRAKVRPAGPNPVANYHYYREAPAASLNVNVFEYVPSSIPHQERISGVRQVDVFLQQSEERGAVVFSASWSEGRHLVSAGGFGISRAEFLAVIKLLRGA